MHGIKAVLIFVLVSSVLGRPKTEDGQRLIKTSETEPAKWLSQEEILTLISGKIHFMDVTDRVFPKNADDIVPRAFPTTLRFRSIVESISSLISVSRLQNFVDTFDNYPNRYYQSQNGANAANWILSEANAVITNTSYAWRASATAFAHTWVQDSVIARIEGSDPALRGEVLIFGAHLDSINGGNPNGVAPGADDNGSGSATLMEAWRVLLESGFIPKRSIEFQWYAAEEVGLRGSGDIAQAYSRANTSVIGMVNFDVVGYRAGRNEIGLLTDYTDRALNVFLKMVIDGYCTYAWVDDVCGYACSDHAPFNQYGFPAASPSEYPLNPYMHTTSDTMNRISFEQVAEFVKLTVGAAIEITEPAM